MAWKLARFHILFGPVSLFDRVRHIMAGPKILNLENKHFKEKDVPSHVVALLRNFDSCDWELKTAAVYPNSGKFFRSGWYRKIHNAGWFVSIGLGDTVVTCFEVEDRKKVEKVGLSRDTIESGHPLYDKVEAVNAQLMAEVLEQQPP